MYPIVSLLEQQKTNFIVFTFHYIWRKTFINRIPSNNIITNHQSDICSAHKFTNIHVASVFRELIEKIGLNAQRSPRLKNKRWFLFMKVFSD